MDSDWIANKLHAIQRSAFVVQRSDNGHVLSGVFIGIFCEVGCAECVGVGLWWNVRLVVILAVACRLDWLVPALLEDELVVLELGVVVVELLLSVWDELLVLSETLTLMSVSDWETFASLFALVSLFGFVSGTLTLASSVCCSTTVILMVLLVIPSFFAVIV